MENETISSGSIQEEAMSEFSYSSNKIYSYVNRMKRTFKTSIMLMMQSSDFLINHILNTAIYMRWADIIKEIVKSNSKIAIS